MAVGHESRSMWRGFLRSICPPIAATNVSLSLSARIFAESGRYREQHRLRFPRLIDVNVWLAMRRKEGRSKEGTVISAQATLLVPHPATLSLVICLGHNTWWWLTDLQMLCVRRR